jgi:hypothetical protein
MTTAEQWAHLVETYGFPAAFFIVCVVGVSATIYFVRKAYPMLSATVDFINLLKGEGDKPGLDKRLDKIEEAGRLAQASSDRKEEVLKDLAADVTKTKDDLHEHMIWSEHENGRFKQHLDLSERQAAEWRDIRDGWTEVRARVAKMSQVLEGVDSKTNAVVHEVKPNGGSSIKDATKRQEDRLDAILNLLKERVSEHSGD